jgi:CheY-like chemotaxis protein
MKNYAILLATDDSAVEAVVRALGTSTECDLKCVKTSREALSMVMDGSWSHDLAVVDLDMHDGGRALLTTAGGALPVIAISGTAKPWLSSMLRHRRIGATLTKPVSPEKLRAAVLRVRSVASIEEQRGN